MELYIKIGLFVSLFYMLAAQAEFKKQRAGSMLKIGFVLITTAAWPWAILTTLTSKR